MADTDENGLALLSACVHGTEYERERHLRLRDIIIGARGDRGHPNGVRCERCERVFHRTDTIACSVLRCEGKEHLGKVFACYDCDRVAVREIFRVIQLQHRGDAEVFVENPNDIDNLCVMSMASMPIRSLRYYSRRVAFFLHSMMGDRHNEDVGREVLSFLCAVATTK